MKTQIPLYKVHWTEDDVNAVTQVIKRGLYWTGGPENQVFENAVASYVDRKHGVAFNSGTSALTALLLAHGVGPGDEVIVPAFTYPSTSDAVKFAGATPVYADIEEETYGLDTDNAEKRITERTKAIIAVHVYGLPCRIRELCAMAKTHGLLLIEDAAEALGATVNSERAGSFGDAAFFSFAGNKIVSMGEGGVAVTDSEQVERKLREVRQSHSWRMSSIQAALGLSLFKRLEHLLERRR
ncbi:MAG: aminotransferase class I/II-fold pyridoxal phosphate-dependent enzyme, partial [Chloroflexota bacterium]|nr:aminotransferase class I/II-fold pyridoxal phosphate-dependent enzyme [Chloroflexota bacterium]